jgi:hypothetical protein
VRNYRIVGKTMTGTFQVLPNVHLELPLLWFRILL